MQKIKAQILIVMFVLFLLPASILYAQEARKITIAEAIELSIKNSKLLQLSKAKISEAVAATREAKERRQPDASVSGSYLRLNNANVKMAGSDTGGKSPLSINQAIYGTATISYPVFSGYKIKYGIEAAQFLEKAATLDAEKDRQDVILNTTAAYVNLYKATVTAKLMEENIVQSKQRDLQFAGFERNGLMARNDILKSQLQTSQIELGLLDAQNAVQLAQVSMNLLLGLPESPQLVLDTAFLLEPIQVKTIKEYEQMAAQNSYDVKALNSRKKAAEAGIKIARGDYYPNVGIGGGYMAGYIPNLVTITNAFNVSVGVKYSLSSLWKTAAKVQQAKEREQQLEASEGMLLDDIRLGINKACHDYLFWLKKLEVLNKDVEQSAENYRISKNKYNNNLLTLTDLLEADIAQLRSKLNLATAKADVYVAYQTLLQKAGLLNQ
ncbi:MAG: TolC family protein [Ferruginibacter sp.]